MSSWIKMKLYRALQEVCFGDQRRVCWSFWIFAIEISWRGNVATSRRRFAIGSEGLWLRVCLRECLYFFNAHIRVFFLDRPRQTDIYETLWHSGVGTAGTTECKREKEKERTAWAWERAKETLKAKESAREERQKNEHKISFIFIQCTQSQCM